MSMYYSPLLLPLSRLHHFNCLSVGNKQALCPLMWGAQEKSEGAHQKIFGRRFAPVLCPPHLQIASDATVIAYRYIYTMVIASDFIVPIEGMRYCASVFYW